MRKNKELQIQSYPENFTVKLGTINKYNPEVIYIYGTTWLSPNIEKPSYDEISDDFSKKMKKTLFAEFRKTHMFDENIISDVDIRKSGILFNKKRFVNFEIHLKQKEVKNINDEKLKAVVTEIMNSVLNTIVKTTSFNFSNKKD